MTASINVLNPAKPKRALILVSNPTVSEQTGWPIGFWWAELTHPYWEFVEKGYEVDLASPDGGELKWDSWSDPRDESGYSAHDLISLGFINSPQHFQAHSKDETVGRSGYRPLRGVVSGRWPGSDVHFLQRHAGTPAGSRVLRSR